MTDMTAEQARKILSEHNNWRRVINFYEMADPVLIGQAIDVAIEALSAPRVPDALPYWPTCNPACEPELGGFRTKGCHCEPARAAMLTAAQSPAERNNIGASFSKMPPYEYQRQVSSGDGRIAATIAPAPAEPSQDELSTLREETVSAMREASSLAINIWRQHYKDVSPNFELCDSVAGIITQIDNMAAGLSEKIVERDAEIAALRERVKMPTMAEIYAEFTEWCKQNQRYDLDCRLHTHGGPIAHGGYIAHWQTRIAFDAYKAARLRGGSDE